MKLRLRERTVGVTIGPLVVIVMLLGSMDWLQVQTTATTVAARQASLILIAAENLQISVLRAETGMRGYVATGRRGLARPFDQAAGAVPAQIANLLRLSAADPVRLRKARAIGDSARSQMRLTARIVRMMRAGRAGDALREVASGREDASMAGFQARVATFSAEVAQWRADSAHRRDMLWESFEIVCIAGGIVAIVTALWASLGLTRGLVGRLRALAAQAERFRTGRPLGDPIGGADEIAELEGTFRRMASEVAERHETLARYELLSGVTTDNIFFVCRATLHIIDANAAAVRTYGYTREELQGLPVASLRTPETAGRLEFELTGADSAQGVTYETMNRRKDGSSFPVEVVARSATMHGQPVIVATIRDITERRHTAEELDRALKEAVQASQLKSEFVATMSHEIRTPMNAVIGMSELLAEAPLAPDQRELAATIKESAHALLTIVNDILDFSKMEAGRLDLEDAALDVTAVIDGVVSLLRPTAAAKSIEFVTDVPPRLAAPLRGDPGRLRQVLMNLAGNAVKFTERGNVTIAASTDLEDEDVVSVRFQVSDTGAGISPQVRARLFEPFAQGDSSMTRVYGGTGLGLSISRRLVELMGGEIGVESVEGKGSTFWFTARFTRAADDAEDSRDANVPSSRILIVDDDVGMHAAVAHALGRERSDVVAVPAAGPGSTIEGPMPRPARILLADDNATNQRVASLQMNRLGYALDLVANGREAVEAVAEGAYDLVLMDCQMPVMDGYAATRAIREAEEESRRHVPIIALTADALERDRRRCIEAGMNDFLTKPLQLEPLQTMLERWLPSREAEIVLER